MSSTTKSHSSATLSTSSSTASIQRQSYPEHTRNDHTLHHHRNVHSAPAAYSPQQTLKGASDLSLSSKSTAYASDDSTAVASSSSNSASSPSKHKPKSKSLSAEDELWANKINAELAAKTEATANEGRAKAKAKAKRGCIGAVVDEFDFGYANVPSRGSKYGRRSAGGSGLGRCELM